MATDTGRRCDLLENGARRRFQIIDVNDLSSQATATFGPSRLDRDFTDASACKHDAGAWPCGDCAEPTSPPARAPSRSVAIFGALRSNGSARCQSPREPSWRLRASRRTRHPMPNERRNGLFIAAGVLRGAAFLREGCASREKDRQKPRQKDRIVSSSTREHDVISLTADL